MPTVRGRVVHLLGSRKRNDYFSSKAPGQQQPDTKAEETLQSPKRKTTRSPAAKNSLRRVAVEAQRSRDGKEPRKAHTTGHHTSSKMVTAICAAEEYDIAHVARILQGFGYDLDPYKTDLYPQVVHIALPIQTDPVGHGEATLSTGDLFVFPSGTVVAWGIPESVFSALVSNALLPAARYPLDKLEEEDLEYIEDPKRENSSIRGDRIILGTKPQALQTTEDDPVECIVGLMNHLADMENNFLNRNCEQDASYSCYSMRRQALTIPVTKDVCIFCATRIRLAAARASLRPQRRFLGSTGAARRPETASVAHEQDTYADSNTSSQWKISPTPFTQNLGGASSRSGRILTTTGGERHAERAEVVSKSVPRARRKDDGWAKTQNVNDLTPEEENLRAALKRKAATGEESHIQKATLSTEDKRKKPYDSFANSVRWRPGAPASGDLIAGRSAPAPPDSSDETTRKYAASDQPTVIEKDIFTEDTKAVLPDGQQNTADRKRALRADDGWKRWESEDVESSSHSQAPTPEVAAPKIVTYSPISTAGEQPPQLFRAVGGKAGAAMQRLRERNPGREPLVARESQTVVSPFVSQGNRDRARRSNKQRVSKTDRDEEYGDDEDIMADRRMERKEQRKKAKAAQKARAPPTPIYLPEFISVSNLAGALKVRIDDFIYKMKTLGFEEMNNDHILDAETAGLVAAEFNFEPIIDREEDRDIHPLPPAEAKSSLPARPPVVTIMGHVDHGKTTLLDYLRKSSVAASEHGGITQHIGAFSVAMPGGRLVTFLDTPGHEAFLSMRQRGANVTDIVILVVAADDSVKPQTIEAIKHAQAAKVPMIVAVNKIDKEDSNVEKVKQDLARYGVEIEDYGGDTQVVCVSGKTGQGMEELEDAAVALADILDMRAEIDGQAEGWVLEATTKKAGRVATILVRRGTLRPGDVIVAGTSWARVRSLRNEAGVMIPAAGPGTPVEIDGWREQPAAGDEVIQASDEQKAKSVVDYRLEASERTRLAADMEAVNEARRLEQEKRDQLEKAAELAAALPDTPVSTTQEAPATVAAGSTFQEVFFVIKGDVSGSVEAVTNSVSALGNSEVRPHILRSGVGPVTEFDVDHAAVAKGHIINFNTTVEGPIQRMAEARGVSILDHSIIYRLTDDVKKTLSDRLPSTVTQKVLGEAEIGQVFEINIKGRVKVPIAGCRIRNGVIGRTNKVRVLRGKETIYDGTLSSLKNVKKDVTEMRKGNECGMSFENWTSFQLGDQVQTYEEIIEKRNL
ncbi:translation initiation factor IF-2, partial [Lecanoromycetidae sp. Uapishka_2]